MFDKLKSMAAVAALMKNQDGLKRAGARIREEMERTRVTGQAGGGAVRVMMTGKMKVLEVELAPALVAGMSADDRTRSLAGSLIADATNDALAQVQAALAAAVEAEAKGLGFPELGAGLKAFLP